MNYGKNATRHRAKNLDAKGTKYKNKLLVILERCFLVCVLLIAVAGLSSGYGVWRGIIDSAPDISAIDVTPTGYSSTVLASDGSETATLVASGSNRKYVTIDEIPVDLQHAFVAIEDSRFYEHNGIDIKGIFRALATDLRSHSTAQGASTITQQLIKNSVLENVWANEGTSTIEKLQRKIQEQYLAVELEDQVDDKDWILENYLNTINLGSNTLGVQAASERYFGKDVSELTLSECAVIAGITKNPSAYNPITHPDKNQERQLAVLENMKEQGYITQDEYDEAVADDVYSRIAEHNTEISNTKSTNSYFVDAVIDDVIADLENELGYSEAEAYKALYQGGLTICSTQDLEVQAIADEEVANADNYPANTKYSFSLYFEVVDTDGEYHYYTHQTMLSYYKETNPSYDIDFDSEEECMDAIAAYEEAIVGDGDTMVEGSESITITLQPQVAMTIMDQSTGQVVALVGGRGEKEGNRTLNRATDTTRQPGSTFKILGCYAAALDAGGMTLASVQDNQPYTVGTKQYRNYDDKYTGWTTIRSAITNSINIVTVKTIEDIGVDLAYEYAESFGFTTLCDSDKNLGLALGGLTNGVTNLELTAAYASIANGGEYQQPKFYTIVYDHDGNILLDARDTQEKHQVVTQQTAWLLTSAMEDVMTEGTGTKAYFGETMAQAGKSGTTTSNRDCLFAGYTPYYTCVIWGGYDDNAEQQSGETSYPKYLWNAVMSRIHEGLEYKDFDVPAGIVESTFCLDSGKLAISGVCRNDPRGSRVRTEYFAQGTQPTQACDKHVAVKVCNDSGMAAAPGCTNVSTVVRLKVWSISGTGTNSLYGVTNDYLNATCGLHGGSGGTSAPANSIGSAPFTDVTAAIAASTAPSTTAVTATTDAATGDSSDDSGGAAAATDTSTTSDTSAGSSSSDSTTSQ